MQQTWRLFIGYIVLGRMNQRKLPGHPHVWFVYLSKVVVLFYISILSVYMSNIRDNSNEMWLIGDLLPGAGAQNLNLRWKLTGDRYQTNNAPHGGRSFLD